MEGRFIEIDPKATNVVDQEEHMSESFCFALANTIPDVLPEAYVG